MREKLTSHVERKPGKGDTKKVKNTQSGQQRGPEQDFSTSAPLTFGARSFFVMGTVLYIVGVGQPPDLPTKHQPVSFYPPVVTMKKCPQTVLIGPSGQTSPPVENHWPRRIRTTGITHASPCAVLYIPLAIL